MRSSKESVFYNVLSLPSENPTLKMYYSVSPWSHREENKYKFPDVSKTFEHREIMSSLGRSRPKLHRKDDVNVTDVDAEIHILVSVLQTSTIRITCKYL